MKRTLSLALALVLAATALAGCSFPALPRLNTAPSPTPSPEPAKGIEAIKTVGDTLALDSPEYQSAAYENAFVCVFLLDGVYYRAVAPLSAETAAEIWALDYDESYDARRRELVSPLQIERVENLSNLIPTQAELDELVGRTGAELLDEGWQSYGYKLDTMEFYLTKGPFKYTVVFDGEPEPGEDFDAYETLGPLMVSSVTFSGLGDAATLD